MYPVVSCWPKCLKNHHLITMYPLDKCTFAPSEAGSESFDEERWRNNPMNELFNDDAIHAYRIRLSEQLRSMDLARVQDPVMMRLLNMGTFDWKSPNSIAGPIQGMSFAAVLMSRILPRVLDLEDKVSSAELLLS